jgi:S-adenosylmethionine-dependent methyltransferase
VLQRYHLAAMKPEDARVVSRCGSTRRQDDAVERIRAHYQTYATEELERLAKDRYARIEFEVTWRFIAELLPPGARVLDAGSGPGRYAVALAQGGHTVTLLDLSPHCLELAEEWARVVGVTDRFEALEEGDVRDLSRWPDASFDAVLLLGPLYHLLSARERTRCVREVRRVLKPGGPVIASAISRFTPARLALKYWPEQIDAPELRRALADGAARAVPGAAWTDAAYLRPEALRRLFERNGFVTHTLAAAEGFAGFMEDAINRLNDAQWDAWLPLIVETCDDPLLLGAAAHTIYVGRSRTAGPSAETWPPD